MIPSTTRVRRFTRDEYERMAAQGILRADEHVELLQGEIVPMTPQGSHHTVVVHLIAKALERAFGPGYWVRIQSPLALSDNSEPEPDVAVVRGAPRDFYSAQPKTALLLVEVAESTLASDREVKAGMYAEAGIPEYWIANLVDGTLEVHREPRKQNSGARYASITRLDKSAHVIPTGVPGASIAVGDVLP
jgi:Uma2 family endonuclease